MGKYEDDHIPTPMLDNKPKILSHVLGPVLHMEVLSHQDAWKYWHKIH